MAMHLTDHQQNQIGRLENQLHRLHQLSTSQIASYSYPNGIDFHHFKPTPELSHVCYYCERTTVFFLHEEPYASRFSEAVTAKRMAKSERSLSDTHHRFIELDKRKDEIKKFYEELREVTERLVAENGVGHFFQDADGTVYKTVVPDGTFVQFKKYDVKRTRRGEEKKGELSLTEAREAGFTVEGK